MSAPPSGRTLKRRLDVPLTIADQGEAELIGLFRQMSAGQRRALARFALRHTNGVPFPVALARLRTEMARARPNSGSGE